jgi:hypothetical protein
VTCVYTPKDLDGVVKMIENCAITYGGPGWVSLAMMGLAFVLMVMLAAFTLFLLLRALR